MRSLVTGHFPLYLPGKFRAHSTEETSAEKHRQEKHPIQQLRGLGKSSTVARLYALEFPTLASFSDPFSPLKTRFNSTSCFY